MPNEEAVPDGDGTFEVNRPRLIPTDLVTRPATEQEPRQLTVQEVADQHQKINELMSKLMRDGQHYGRIPGCGNKPSLFKPGAELIAKMFKLSVNPVITDLSTDDEIRYRIVTRITHIPTGAFVGAGVGECSSREKKYRYKKPSDVANTVLKMAKKRSMVDGILTATGASDFWAQDLEEKEKAHEAKDDGTGLGGDPPRHDVPREWLETITSYAEELGLTQDQVNRALATRGAKFITDLTREQALEVGKTLKEKVEAARAADAADAPRS